MSCQPVAPGDGEQASLQPLELGKPLIESRLQLEAQVPRGRHRALDLP